MLTVKLKSSVGNLHCADFIRSHYKMSDQDLATELHCTIGYVRRVRKTAAQEAAAGQKVVREEVMVSKSEPQLALNFAAQPKPSRQLSREKVLLAMGFVKNTEQYMVAWLILKYGSVSAAQHGLDMVAGQLHNIQGAARVLSQVAA